jgi:hypothetical protein
MLPRNASESGGGACSSCANRYRSFVTDRAACEHVSCVDGRQPAFLNVNISKRTDGASTNSPSSTKMRCTHLVSPVSIDWSTEQRPSITTLSAGMRSPGSTRSMSPRRIVAVGTSISWVWPAVGPGAASASSTKRDSDGMRLANTERSPASRHKVFSRYINAVTPAFVRIYEDKPCRPEACARALASNDRPSNTVASNITCNSG